MSYYPQFANLLNQYLTRMDRSAAWLAKRLGVSAPTVARWQSGEYRPKDPETVQRLADALRLSKQEREELFIASGYGLAGPVDTPQPLADAPQPKLEKGNETSISIPIIQQVIFQSPARSGSAPPMPSLIIGREDALRDLKTRLDVTVSSQTSTNVQVLTAVRGWPGVGKTTIAAALAHDPEIAAVFPDGVLWISLGPEPHLLSDLATWGRALGTDELLHAKSVEEASAQLTGLLRNKRMLLIVDDVWEPAHAIPFKVGGRGCAMLVTTRNASVAQALAPTPNDIYKLLVLTDEKALELLQTLAPTVVAQYPQESLELVRELEGLPLALQVAGHMLNVEISYGFSVIELLSELREGAKLLEAQAPVDRTDLANETTPTIAVLLQRSTDRIDEHTRDCFAYLGAFAPKPATFDLGAMKAVWQVEDPKPVARTLMDRGLLELVPTIERYQMHALLVAHAKSLLTED